jgi:hypothetical protein
LRQRIIIDNVTTHDAKAHEYFCDEELCRCCCVLEIDGRCYHATGFNPEEPSYDCSVPAREIWEEWLKSQEYEDPCPSDGCGCGGAGSHGLGVFFWLPMLLLLRKRTGIGGALMRVSMAGVVSAVLFTGMSCSWYGEYPSSASECAECSAQDVSSQDGIVGRLWVSPPAIRFRPGQESDARFALANTGSEDVWVEAVTVTGDPDFHSVDFIGGIRLPMTLFGSDDCGGFGTIDGTIAYTPKTGNDARGILKVHTEDPTSPSFSVPVYLDADSSYPGEILLPGEHFPVHEPSVMVNPNPIRFDGTTTKVDICIVVLDLGIARARIAKLWIDGDSFSISGPLYQGENPAYYRTSIKLNQSALVLKDGYLAVEFDDPCGILRKLRVPILYK